jgi:hypothetical protein
MDQHVLSVLSEQALDAPSIVGKEHHHFTVAGALLDHSFHPFMQLCSTYFSRCLVVAAAEPCLSREWQAIYCWNLLAQPARQQWAGFAEARSVLTCCALDEETRHARVSQGAELREALGHAPAVHRRGATSQDVVRGVPAVALQPRAQHFHRVRKVVQILRVIIHTSIRAVLGHSRTSAEPAVSVAPCQYHLGA